MDILESLSGPRLPRDSTEKAASVTDATAQQRKAPDKAQGKADAVDAWFVDLFVRCNNKRAAEMYEKLGYSVYRRVVEYVSTVLHALIYGGIS
jgi:N-terminal acetyltransferase B complex catalytic subunit